jgi:hypothetical protein
MDPPFQVSVTPNGLTSSILIEWHPDAFDGGLPVLGYFLQINSGYGTSFNPNMI